MTVNHVLEAQKLYKKYEIGDSTVKALDGIDLTIDAGDFLVLLGPSGAGKSTLLHVLSGLEPPDKGTVMVDGQDIYSLSDRKLSRLRSQTFGFIFQAYNLVASLTVQENVEIPLRIAQVRDATKKAREMLGRVGLANRMHHRPGQLSGGEQQRVSIARALVCNPKLVFADEPTGNLDSKSGEDIMHLLEGLVKEQHAACVMVTHNTAWSERANRVLHLKDGRLGN